MQSKFDKYTLELKSKLDKNYLSPLFIRLANLLYANEHYEECIAVCKTGLEIYPNYLTAKLILLKAFLKAEYLNEAEILYKEIKTKLTNSELRSKFENNIQNLKAISKQEKIYYPKSSKYKYDYKSFEKKFNPQENLFSEFSLKDLFDESKKIKLNAGSEKDFGKFMELLETFHFEKNLSPVPGNIDASASKANPPGQDELLSKIKIVTETLADIYAQQGNFNEAFDAYNILLRAGSGNRKRIEEKLNELERNVNRQT